MSRRIPDNRLTLLHLQLSRRVLMDKDLKGPIYDEVDVREYACIVEELRRNRGTLGTPIYGELTKALAAMKVGDKIRIPPRTQSSITTCRKSARSLMGIPDARWHAQQTGGGFIDIERMPDGSSHLFGKPPNPLVDQLAAMNINGRLKTTCTRNYFHNQAKVLARKKMNKPFAKWSAKTLTTGLFIIRTA